MRIRRVFGIVSLLAIVALLGWWLFQVVRSRTSNPLQTPNEIRFAHFGEFEDHEFWKQTIDQFASANSDIDINMEFPAASSGKYGDEFRRQVFDQTLPEILLVPMNLFQEWSGQFEDLNGLMSATITDALEPTGIRAFQVEGKQRGLPIAGGNLLIFLNRRCLQKASEFHGKTVEFPGSDWTAAEFLRTAEALTCDFNRDGVTDQYGFRLPGWMDYLPFIWSFGADITDKDATHWTFSGPAAQSAMRFYRQMATGDRVVPRDGESPPLTQVDGFLSGKVAMCVNGPWFVSILDQSDLAGDYGVAPIPRGPGCQATRITWDGMVMRKNLSVDQRKKAWRFIEWTISKEVQIRLARLGRALPARVDVQDEFITLDPTRRKPFVDALSYSRLLPPLQHFESLDRAITRYFNEASNPDRTFDASTMLEELARDPAVVGAFSQTTRGSP